MRESGQSLVEMALVFTTVLFMLSILVDVGRAFFSFIALHDAAQEGAIHASMDPKYLTAIERWPDAIQAILTSSSEPIDLQAEYASGNFRVEPLSINDYNYYDPGHPGHVHDCAGFNSTGEANTVNVIVAYDFHFIMPLMDTIVPGGIITLRAQSYSTIMYPPCP